VDILFLQSEVTSAVLRCWSTVIFRPRYVAGVAFYLLCNPRMPFSSVSALSAD